MRAFVCVYSMFQFIFYLVSQPKVDQVTHRHTQTNRQTHTHTYTHGELGLPCRSLPKEVENNFLNNTPFISTSNKIPSLSLAFTIGWLNLLHHKNSFLISFSPLCTGVSRYSFFSFLAFEVHTTDWAIRLGHFPLSKSCPDCQILQGDFKCW